MTEDMMRLYRSFLRHNMMLVDFHGNKVVLYRQIDTDKIMVTRSPWPVIENYGLFK
jgi:hypothetical protein